MSAKMRAAAPLLIASYAADWLVLVAAAVVGFALGRIAPNKRPFDPQDRDINFPYAAAETVSTLTLVLSSVVAPLVVVLAVTLVFVPGPTAPRDAPRALVWRRRLWELHAGWLGLALSLAASWFITNGLKNMLGKPRPDLVARCQLGGADVSGFVVSSGAAGSSLGQLVSAAICTNPDAATLDDGFRSFPSGHSSMSAAGLVYLSLFLASKLAIAVPFLPAVSASDREADALRSSAFPSRAARRRAAASPSSSSQPQEQDTEKRAEAEADRGNAAQAAGVAGRRQAAAPPLYLLAITSIPSFAAIFISSSRWFDFRHHGFDILFGFAIGTATAFFAFRYYHLPVGSGAGWAWGPRSTDKAFWAGVGSNSYATEKHKSDTSDATTG